MEKPLPRLIDMRAAMRRRQDLHNTVVEDHYQIDLDPEDRRLLWSYYQTGDVAQFSKLHYLLCLNGFLHPTEVFKRFVAGA